MQSTQQATRDGSRTEPTLLQPKAGSHGTIDRFRVKPVDVGIAGFVDGGTLLEWIDKAAYAAAAQWCGCHCVAASVGNVHLDRPIGVGELVEVHASLVYTGRSSMHILVTVHSSEPTRTKAAQTSQCPIIFVAVDDTGNAVEVPRWTPVTMLELQRQRQARVRIRMRNRIEGAMAAQSYTAEGTAPAARCASSPRLPTSARAAMFAPAESCGGSTKRPMCAEPIGPTLRSSRPTSPGSASTGPSSSATPSKSPPESFTLDRAASTPASTSPPPTRTAVNLTS